jgi:hypothetical protein
MVYFMKTDLPSYVPPPAHCGTTGALTFKKAFSCRNAPGAVCGWRALREWFCEGARF